MTQVPGLHYSCDACEEVINPSHARAHCLECEDHDLCLRCHSTGGVSKQYGHKSSHSTEVIRPPWTEPHGLQTPTEGPPTNTATRKLDPARYWGTLRSAEGVASPMFARLCSAIFNYFDATVEPVNTNLMEPSKVAAAEEAMGLFDAWNIFRDLQDGILRVGGTIDEGDELIKVSWTAREIVHVMTTRQSENPVWHGMPALTRESFTDLHMRKLSGDPAAYWQDISNLLKEIPELVDPVTGEGFEHREIPWDCFPQEPVPEVVEMLRRIDEVLGPAASAWCHKWNERKRQEREQREALAIVALGQSQALAMQGMSMMHSQNMMAISAAYPSFAPSSSYIR